MFVTISAISLKHSSSSSCVNRNWSYSPEYVLQLHLLPSEVECLRSGEVDAVAAEISEMDNDAAVSY